MTIDKYGLSEFDIQTAVGLSHKYLDELKDGAGIYNTIKETNLFCKTILMLHAELDKTKRELEKTTHGMHFANDGAERNAAECRKLESQLAKAEDALRKIEKQCCSNPYCEAVLVCNCTARAYFKEKSHE